MIFVVGFYVASARNRSYGDSSFTVGGRPQARARPELNNRRS
jgi:hypothetical protein